MYLRWSVLTRYTWGTSTLADKAYEELRIDKIVFVPGGIPPWKNPCFKIAAQD